MVPDNDRNYVSYTLWRMLCMSPKKFGLKLLFTSYSVVYCTVCTLNTRSTEMKSSVLTHTALLQVWRSHFHSQRTTISCKKIKCFQYSRLFWELRPPSWITPKLTTQRKVWDVNLVWFNKRNFFVPSISRLVQANLRRYDKNSIFVWGSGKIISLYHMIFYFG